MEHTPTDEQTAIFDAVRNTKSDIVIDALAGAAKTTTILASLAFIPQRSILLCAFNKRIQETLLAKLPQLPAGTVVHVRTFHAQGLSILKSKFPHVEVNKQATEELINHCAGALAFKPRRIAVKILRGMKEITTAKAPSLQFTFDHIAEYGHREDLFGPNTDDKTIDAICKVVFDAYAAGIDFKNRKTIDFCDMVWGPLVAEIPPKSRYQAVVVDEMQDMSKPQLEMLQASMAPGGRLIGVGDKNQAIYGFRGGIPDKVYASFRARGAVFLPLTTTFRCARLIVEQAQQLVPDLQAREGAPDGIVRSLHFDQLAVNLLRIKWEVGEDQSIPQTFVLSRNNADLLSCALRLWRERVSFQLNAGRDMLEPLFQILDVVGTTQNSVGFMSKLATWYTSESKRAEAAHAAAWAERLDEQYRMLTVAAAYAAPHQIRKLLTDMIEASTSGVLLSTVHKVKGLEAERVFLLKQTFQRHAPLKYPDSPPPPIDAEELNLEYVGITRAKTELVWVDMVRS